MGRGVVNVFVVRGTPFFRSHAQATRSAEVVTKSSFHCEEGGDGSLPHLRQPSRAGTTCAVETSLAVWLTCLQCMSCMLPTYAKEARRKTPATSVNFRGTRVPPLGPSMTPPPPQVDGSGCSRLGTESQSFLVSRADRRETRSVAEAGFH